MHTYTHAYKYVSQATMDITLVSQLQEVGIVANSVGTQGVPMAHESVLPHPLLLLPRAIDAYYNTS